MAAVWNPTTGRYEDDGQPETRPTSPPIVATLEPSANVRPLTGAPVSSVPDQVSPSDLETGTVPEGPPSQARRYASIDQPEPGASTPEQGAAGQELIDRLDAGTLPTGKGFPGRAVPATGAPGAPPPTPTKAGPPGMVTTGTSSTSSSEADRMTAKGAKRQGALDTDVAEEKANSAARSDQEKELGKKNLQITKDTNAQIAAAQAETDRQVAVQDQAIARFEDHVEAKRQALESQPLTSFWASRTNEARFMAAISGAIGTYAAARSGGRNFAQERIDRAVDQDFKEQEAQIANRKDLLALAKQDVQAAELKKKGLIYDLQIKKVALLDTAERTRSEELAAHGLATADIAKDEKLVAIQKKRDEESAALKDSFVRDVKSYTTQKAPAPTGAVPAGNVVFGPGGKPLGAASTAKGAEDTNDSIAGYSNMQSGLKKYMDMIAKHGSSLVIPRKASGDMQTLRANLLFEANHMVNTGVLRPSEQEYFEAMIPEATGFHGTTTANATMLAKLKQMSSLIRSRMAGKLDSVGVGRDVLSHIDDASAALEPK